MADNSDITIATHLLHYITPSDFTQFLQKNTDSTVQSRLTTLLDVSSAISEIQDLEILLKRILTIVCRDLPVDRGFIGIIQPNNKYEIKAVFDRANIEKSKKDESYSKTITRKVLLRRAPLLYKNVSPSGASQLSCLSVPLNCKGKLLGLIQLESFSKKQFNHDDLDEMRKIAMEMAMAIENLNTYFQPVRYSAHLIALSRFSQSLSRHLDRQKILEEGVQAARSLFGSTRVSILLADKDQRHLKIAYALGIPTEEWDKTVIAIEGSIAGKVFQKNKPLVVANIQNLPQEFRQKQGIFPKYVSNSCILAPIRMTTSYLAREGAIGVVCVTDKRDTTIFTGLERNLLALLANQIGIAFTNAQLYEKATIDPLTKVTVRGYFFQRLQEEVYRASANTALSFLMLDIDHFKNINDHYTHQGGDRVLEQMGALLMNLKAKDEWVGRYGGEEFMMLLPMDHAQAVARAQEIQRKIVSRPFVIAAQQTVFLTSSIGVSTLRPTDTPSLLLERADKALYLAKESGRNRVVGEEDVARYEEQGNIQISRRTI